MKKKIISIIIAIGLLAGTWDMAVLAQDLSRNDAAEVTESEEKIDLSTELSPQAVTYAQFNTSNMYAIANYGIKKLQNKDMLLKVPGNKNGRVMPMIISPADHSTGELFGFSKVSNWYTLTPKCAGSWRLNVEGEKAATNVDVGLWTNTNHSTQGWYFEPVSGIADGYIIRSANNPECVLDIRGTSTGTGVKVKKYESDNLHQIWIVRAYAASISLNKTAATMDIGKTLALTANRRPVNAGISYSSNNTKVATVSSNGLVTAKAAGTAVIYAKCYGKTASCQITVRKSTLSIGSSIKKTTITKGSKNGVSGTVSSNKKITKITAQIIGKSNKKTYYSKTVKPNKTSYKLTGTIDNAMKFDKLGKGVYIFRVTAWDTAGNKVVKDIGCTVNEKAKVSSAGKSTGDSKNKTLSYDKNKIAGLKNQKAIGDHVMCGAFSIAYCRGIRNGDYRSVYTYWSSAGAAWGNGGMKKSTVGSFQTELNKAYNQVKAGKPCIIRVREKKSFSSNPGLHYVTVIGYKNVKNDKKVSLSELVILDPYDGKVLMGNKRHENPKSKSQYQIITF